MVKEVMGEKGLGMFFPIKSIFMILVAMSISACGVAKRATLSNMDDVSLTEAVRDISSDKICSHIEGDWGDQRYQKFIRAEAERRKLGDCSDAHKLCVEVGYSYKTEEYAACRIKLAQSGYGSSGGGSNSTTKAMGGALSDWGAKMQDGYYAPKSAPVKNCTSYRVGNTVQTNCY